MKKKLYVLLASVLAVIGLAFGVAGCSGSSGDTDSKTDDIIVSFVNEEDVVNGEIASSKLVPELNCQKDEVYFMVVDFKIQAKFKNDGNQSITLEMGISPMTLLNATVQEANSGDSTEETKDGVKNIKVTYKVPDLVQSKAKSARIVVKLLMLENGAGEISFNIKGAENTQIGVKEVTKSVTVGFTKELTYTLIDGTYTVTGLSSDTVEEVVIPSLYNGKYVTAIGNGSFAENTKITRVSVPYGVIKIGEKAFYGCTALSKITIPDSVATVSIGAFEDCKGAIQTVMGVDYVDKWVVGYSGDGGEAFIKDGTIGIVGRSFMGKSITSIAIPDTVIYIGESAFSGCTSLLRISIGSGVKSFGERAFYEVGYNSGIVQINYNGTKKQWKAINKGVEYDKYMGYHQKTHWFWDTAYNERYVVYCTDKSIKVENKP